MNRCVLTRNAALLVATMMVVGAGSPSPLAQSKPSGTATSAKLPARLDRYVRAVGTFSSSEIRSLLTGAPVAKVLETKTVHEIAAFGAVWIAASPQQYLDAVNDIEDFEKGGGFRMTKRISDPPRLEDFAALALTSEDVEDLRTCRSGDCGVKLSQSTLQQFRDRIDWSRPSAAADANRLMRETAYEFVRGYLEGGNERLSVYRDSERPTFVASEFTSMIDRLPEFADQPELKRYLLGYPAARLPDATSFLYWQEVEFGLKPTLRINHVVIHPNDERVAIATKMLYASHYFWTALDLRLLVPDPARGRGFWLTTLARSRSDGLTGLGGWFIRRRVRNGAREGALNTLRASKARFESAARSGASRD